MPYKFPQSAPSNGQVDGRSLSSRNISSSNDVFHGKRCLSCSRLLKMWGTRLTMLLVLMFSFGFNSPRWFEWEIEYPAESMIVPPTSQRLDMNSNEQNDNNQPNQSDKTTDYAPNMTYPHHEEGKETVKSARIRLSALAQDNDYFLYYQLIASCIVMILTPAAILLKAYCSFRKATQSRSNKNKTHKIMLIIITMFIICHCPKVKMIAKCSAKVKSFVLDTPSTPRFKKSFHL